MSTASKKQPKFRTNDELGKIFRNRRKELGITQMQIAEQIGTRQQVIGHIEKGTAKRSVYAAEICKILNLNLDTTLFDTDNQPAYLKEDDYQNLEVLFSNTLKTLADFNQLHDKPFIPDEQISDTVKLLLKQLKKYVEEEGWELALMYKWWVY